MYTYTYIHTYIYIHIYIHIYIYIYLVTYNDLTVTDPWNHGLSIGNHHQMAELFKLVNYYNLPRLMGLTMRQ